MILIAHIIIALASIAFTTYLWISPSHAKFKTSYMLVGLTILSGILLVVMSPATMLQACTSGLMYTALVTVGMASARGKLARSRNQ
jgi:hypothetical protein